MTFPLPLETVKDSAAGRLPAIVPALAVGLFLYLPIEPALLAGLQGPAYWVPRLAPDALIALLALVVLVSERHSTALPIRLLRVLVASAIVVVVLNALRGIPIEDGVNGVRVVLRYVLLGAMVWHYGRHLPRPLMWALSAAMVLQLPFLLGEAMSQPGGTPLDGATGRYDRFGLLSASSAVLLLGLLGDRLTPRRTLFVCVALAVVLVLLYLSTSRQAMVGLSAGALIVALLMTGRHPARMVSVLTGVLAIAMVAATPSRMPMPADGFGSPPSLPSMGAPPSTEPVRSVPPAPPSTAVAPLPTPLTHVERGSTALSLDPNRNFRLYLNLVLVPAVLAREPLLGLGPGRHDGSSPDPRFVERVERDGMDWSWGQRFMNDSSYASLFIQYGLILPAALLGLLAALLLRLARSERRRGNAFRRFAVANAVVVASAAAFGPTFEIRSTAVVLWVSVFAALAATVPPVPAGERPT